MNNILYEFPECTICDYDTLDCSVCSDIDDYECSSSGYHTTRTTSCSTDHSHVSRTEERVFNLNENNSTLLKAKSFVKQKPYFQKKRYFGIRKCYRYGDTSHKWKTVHF